MICARHDLLEGDIVAMRAAMAEASRIVLGGFELRTDVKCFAHPDRFRDRRGIRMWNQVAELIARRTTKPAMPMLEAA